MLVVSFSIKRQIALVRMQQCGRSSGVLSERLGIATYFWGFEYITSPLCISFYKVVLLDSILRNNCTVVKN